MDQIKKYVNMSILTAAVTVIASILIMPLLQWLTSHTNGWTFADSLTIYYRRHVVIIILSAMYIVGYLFTRYQDHPASRYVFWASFLPIVWLLFKMPSLYAYGVNFMGQNVTGICGMFFGILICIVALFYIPIFPMCITIQFLQIRKMLRRAKA